MKKVIYLLVIGFLGINSISCTQNDSTRVLPEDQEIYSPANGDVIFHTSKSSQSPIIQKITNSNLSHCGIVYIKNGVPYVFEASSKVKLTKLQTFINNGVDKKYEVLRHTGGLSQSELKKMFAYAQDQIGKSYDVKFEWSDDKIYCSELVWKIYSSAGIELSSPTKFADYDLSSKEAIKLIETRYNTKINLNEDVVTPVQIYQDQDLQIIYQNYRNKLYAF